VVVNVTARTVTVNGRWVSLSHQEFCVLRLLLEHLDDVVPRQALSRAIWGAGGAARYDRLCGILSAVRQKLGDDPSCPVQIVTVWGVGYKFRALPRQENRAMQDQPHSPPRTGTRGQQRVLFVCVHNAGRSQMARAYFNLLARSRDIDAVADSAGTAPGATVNPAAVQAMGEVGLDLAGAAPKLLTRALAREADRIITMGCGVEAGMCPAGTYISEDWNLPDPHGQPIEVVRQVRELVRERVEALLDEMAAARNSHRG
jgi:arsenate reductase